jgi:LuxR family maltose regulon positive regulatory protein
MTNEDEKTPSLIGTAATKAPPAPSRPLFEGLYLGPEQVTIVSAPFGFGKTTLLTDWFHRERLEGHQPRWFSAGAEFRRVAVGRDLMLEGALNAFVLDQDPGRHDVDLDQRTAEQNLVTRCEKVAASDRLIFIDQAELLAESTIDNIVCFAAQLSGSSWRVVLGSRSTIHPPLRDKRVVMTRRIGPAELQLSPSTVDKILISHQAVLNAQARSKIVKQLDGWALGVHLAKAVLVDAPNPNEVATAYCGRDVEISDLFETEIFGGLTQSDQEFLIQCSVLFELDPAGCDFITGEPTSFDHLARLCRDNSLLYARSDGSGYRWMPMARQFVLAKLEQRDEREVALNRRRASLWYQSQGRFDDAVSQALTIRDWESLVQIILARGLETIAAGDPEMVVAWLGQMPSDVLEKEGGLAIIGAVAVWAMSGNEEITVVADWLDVADAHPSSRAPYGAVSTLAASLTARALFASLSAADRLGLARQAVQMETEGSIWAALAHFALGQAAFFDDQPIVARKALSDCLRPTSPRSATVDGLLASSATSLLALLEYQNGETSRANLLLAIADSHGEAGALTPGSLTLARSNRASQGGEPKQALELMLNAGSSSLSNSMRTLAFLNAAIHCAETGRPSESNACLEAAEQYLADKPAPDQLLLRRHRDAKRLQLSAARDGNHLSVLTERELEVVKLLDTDLSRREIAAELFVAHNTVKTYLQRLYRKLEVSSRPAAVASARQRGWLC